jgi:hypothetical protein
MASPLTRAGAVSVQNRPKLFPNPAATPRKEEFDRHQFKFTLRAANINHVLHAIAIGSALEVTQRFVNMKAIFM